MVVEVVGVMACDERKGMMMQSTQIEKEKELLQQQPHQQQPQLPGAATPDPWPPPMSADLVESKSEREIGSHDFLLFVFGRQSSSSDVGFW